MIYQFKYNSCVSSTEVEDWTQTLAKQEGAYDEPAMRDENDKVDMSPVKSKEQKEKRGIYNVTFNDKESTRFLKDIEDVDKALRYEKGFENPVNKKGMGALHIKKYIGNDKDGWVTKQEVLKIGEAIRNVVPYKKNGKNVYEFYGDDGTRFRVVVGKSPNNKERVITFYSNRRAGIENNTLTYVYSTPSDKKIISKEDKNVKLSKKGDRNLDEGATSPVAITSTSPYNKIVSKSRKAHAVGHDTTYPDKSGASSQKLSDYSAKTTANLDKNSPVTGLKPTFNSGDAGRSFDNKIVSKENTNVKLSKKEVDEFKDAIKDGGVDPKAADTIVKIGIKLHGGIAKPVLETVVRPWVNLHAKIVDTMGKVGQKIKRIPLKTVKVPVEKILAFQYNSCVGSTSKNTSRILRLSSFQYNSCVGSTGATQTIYAITRISIQLLCRFNKQILGYIKG